MTTTKTFSNRHLAGEYTPTTLDEVKARTNRLASICGKYYTMHLVNGKSLEIVGKRNFEKWASKNDYVTDF